MSDIISSNFTDKEQHGTKLSSFPAKFKRLDKKIVCAESEQGRWAKIEENWID